MSAQIVELDSKADGCAWGMDCATELCLWSGSSGDDRSSTSADSPRVQRWANEASQCQHHGHRLQRHQETITFFYGAQACVFDLTEVQVKTIICKARREWDETMKRDNCCLVDLQISEPSPQLLINPGFSLKRSLKRFLQERRNRSRGTTSPYCRTPNCSTSSSSSSSS